jgi:outer membrane receptor for ferrienterochelin and colicin/pimeloyl-ACP methyl ester carboxylesterase
VFARVTPACGRGRRVSAVIGAFLLVLGLMPACHTTASPESLLRLEEEIPELNALGKSADALQHRIVMVQSDATEDPVEIAVHEYVKVERAEKEGEEESEARVIVAIHGVLTDHRAWRYVIGALRGEPDVWAIDLPGCGDSGKPNPREASEDAYSPTWLAKHVMSALRKQLARRERKPRITILAHSLGGGVALRMLGDPGIAGEYDDVLGRIDGAILLSPLEFGLSPDPESFRTLARINVMEVTVGNMVGEVRRAAAEAVYGSSINPDRVPKEELDRTYEILTDPARLYAMQYMLQRAIPRDEDDSIDKQAVERLREDYKKVNVPCLVLWGQLDPTLPPVYGAELVQRIPNSVRREFVDCKHSFQIEQPELCVDQVRKFLSTPLEEWEPESPPLMRQPEGGERATSVASAIEGVSRGRKESLKTAPSSVSVVPGQTVPRSGARYVSDSLRMVPGIEVQRFSSTESGVAFRGFVDTSTAAQGTLGLVDNRQVYNQFLGNVLWDQLAVRLEDIKQVEIVRGPGSFIYGPNAMHGVVNILTKSPLDYQRSSASVTAHAGSYDSFVAGATLVRRTDYSGFKMTAQWDDIDQFDNERGDTRNKGFAEAAYEVQLNGEPDHVLGMSTGFSQQLFDLLLPALEAIPDTTAANEGRDLFFNANYRKGGEKDLSFKAQLYWNGFDADFTAAEFYSPFSLNLDSVYFDTQVTWDPEKHRVTGGVGYRHSAFDTFDSDVSEGGHSVNEFWLFVQDEWTISDRLFLTFGARVDHHSETGAHLSPRIAAVWEFARNNFFRASAGRGFRNPSLRELWFDMPITGVPGLPPVTIAGNEDLDPESLTSFEIGYFGAWGPLVDARPGTVIEVKPLGESRQFEAGVNLFYNLVDDLVGFESDPLDPLTVFPVNQDDEEVFGFEVEGRFILRDAFSAFANYSYAVRQNRETGEESKVTPRNTANAGISYTGEKWNAMLWANFRGSSEEEGEKADAYVLINGSVAYLFPIIGGAEGQAFVRFFNLLDDEHKEHPQGDSYGIIITGGLQIDW